MLAVCFGICRHRHMKKRQQKNVSRARPMSLDTTNRSKVTIHGSTPLPPDIYQGHADEGETYGFRSQPEDVASSSGIELFPTYPRVSGSEMDSPAIVRPPPLPPKPTQPIPGPQISMAPSTILANPQPNPYSMLQMLESRSSSPSPSVAPASLASPANSPTAPPGGTLAAMERLRTRSQIQPDIFTQISTPAQPLPQPPLSQSINQSWDMSPSQPQNFPSRVNAGYSQMQPTQDNVNPMTRSLAIGGSSGGKVTVHARPGTQSFAASGAVGGQQLATQSFTGPSTVGQPPPGQGLVGQSLMARVSGTMPYYAPQATAPYSIPPVPETGQFQPGQNPGPMHGMQNVRQSYS